MTSPSDTAGPGAAGARAWGLLAVAGSLAFSAVFIARTRFAMQRAAVTTMAACRCAAGNISMRRWPKAAARFSVRLTIRAGSSAGRLLRT